MTSSASPRSSAPLLALRVLGALALVAVAYVHLDEYQGGYSNIRVIGPLFLLNAISAGLVAVLLLAPVARLRRLDPLLALGGIAVSAGALAALFVSEQTPLFGFREIGYRSVIIQAIVSEALAVVLLSAFMVVRRRRQGDANAGGSSAGGMRVQTAAGA